MDSILALGLSVSPEMSEELLFSAHTATFLSASFVYILFCVSENPKLFSGKLDEKNETFLVIQ